MQTTTKWTPGPSGTLLMGPTKVPKKVLVIEPNNKTAIKKSKELEKRNNYTPFKGIKDKGF